MACFSANMMVDVKNKDGITVLTPLKELRLGDLIQVPGGKWEPIYSFGHYHSTQSAEFLQVQTFHDNVTNILEISPDHMIYILGTYVSASVLKVGDELSMDGSNGTKARITSITTVTRRGVYAPFTPSGTLLVNGIHVSAYVVMLDSAHWLDDQWLAHAYKAPHRWYCYRLNCGKESYTKDGVSNWVSLSLRIVQWTKESWVRMTALLPIMVIMLGFLWAFDQTMICWLVITAFCFYCTMKAAKRRQR